MDSIKCSHCKLEKTHSEFYKNRSSKNGYNNMCKQCFIPYFNKKIICGCGKEIWLRNYYKHITMMKHKLIMKIIDLEKSLRNEN
jgi:hypothetical protein